LADRIQATEIAALAFLTAALLAGCGGRKPASSGRLLQPAGQFSFVPPDGWSRTKLAGIDFVIVSTEPDAGAKPNIFVDFVERSGSLSNVVAGMVQTNRDNHRAYEVHQQEDFVTESGLRGLKISAGRKNKEALSLALFHYLIQDAERTIGLTCTCAEAAKQKYEATFDRAMKSLQSERGER
jgi:hypothetical protein